MVTRKEGEVEGEEGQVRKHEGRRKRRKKMGEGGGRGRASEGK